MPTYKLKKNVDKASETTYRGWRIVPIEGTQMGHRNEGGGLLSTIGIGTRRNYSGYEIYYPDGGTKVVDTLREAKQYIDRYEGDEKSLDKDFVDRQNDGKWIVVDDQGKQTAGPFNSYKEAEHVAGGLAPDWKAKGWGIKSKGWQAYKYWKDDPRSDEGGEYVWAIRDVGGLGDSATVNEFYKTEQEAKRAADEAQKEDDEVYAQRGPVGLRRRSLNEDHTEDKVAGVVYAPGTRVEVRQLGTGTIMSTSFLGSTYQVKLDNGHVAEVAADRIEESEKAWDKGYTAGATGRSKGVNPFSDTKYKVDVVKPKEEEEEDAANPEEEEDAEPEEEVDEPEEAAAEPEEEEEEAADTEGNTAGDADSSSEVRSPTSTSTEAETQGNITVTGGAGEGATTTVTLEGKQGKKRAKWDEGWQQGQHDMNVEQQTKRLMGIV